MPLRRRRFKSLPKSSNGTSRGTAGFGVYEYQKESLRSQAHAKGWTVSYYLNYLLWKDWLVEQESKRSTKGRN